MTWSETGSHIFTVQNCYSTLFCLLSQHVDELLPDTQLRVCGGITLVVLSFCSSRVLSVMSESYSWSRH